MDCNSVEPTAGRVKPLECAARRSGPHHHAEPFDAATMQSVLARADARCAHELTAGCRPPRRVVAVRASSGGGAWERSDGDSGLDAGTLRFNSAHSPFLSQRIAQLRAKEVVQRALPGRPELPSARQLMQHELEADHHLIVSWHENQWRKLRAAAQGEELSDE